MKHENMANKKHGFTLAELLIVVAIIAVLVAISIPIFNRVIEKSREAFDIYTMRAAASAAEDLFYRGINDEESAKANGLLWNVPNNINNLNEYNAYGVYDPKTGKFLERGSRDSRNVPYGKGTTIDGGTRYTLGNSRGAYAADLDYTKGFVMIAIYPYGDNKHIDVYWKQKDGKYVGLDYKTSDPKYSIRIYLND